MPKKSASKVSTMTKEVSDPGLEKPETTSKPKKKDEIDEIFSSRKRKKSEVSKGEKPGETDEKTSMSKKKKKKSKSLRESVDEPDSKPRRKTNDGLKIYSEEELGISRHEAGGTPLCPFDCSCCF